MILDFVAKVFWANRSITHLFWATWANRSRSFICLEWPEGFAHGCSFPLSDLSDRSLSLICLEQSEQIDHSRSFDLSEMSEWANSQPWLYSCKLSRTLQCFLGYCKELWNVFLGIVLHRTLQCVLRYLLYRILQCFLSYCTIKSNGMFSYVLYCTEHCYAFLGIVLSVQNISVFS